MSGQITPRAQHAHPHRLSRALHSLHGDVNQLFNRFLSGVPFHTPFGSPHPSWLDYGFPAPAVDVIEDETSYRVAMEVPGVALADIDISLADDTLTIKGEKREETEEKGKTVHIFERSYGAFRRVFHMPDGVDRQKIAASLDKGVLVVTLPKSAEAAPKTSKIEIKVT